MGEEKEEKLKGIFFLCIFEVCKLKILNKFFWIPATKVVKKLVSKKLAQKPGFQTGPYYSKIFEKHLKK